MFTLAAVSHAYPSWPTPVTFEGHISTPLNSQTHPLTWFYDATVPAWRQDIAGSPTYKALTFLVTADAYYSIRDGNCTTVANSGGFPLARTQFENYTLVGTNETVGGVAVDHWVGTFPGYGGAKSWAQTVYCPSNGPSSKSTVGASGPQECRMPRLLNIDEPGWMSEVKTFESITAGVPEGIFKVPLECAPPSGNRS